jgi:hypothetical protein
MEKAMVAQELEVTLEQTNHLKMKDLWWALLIDVKKWQIPEVILRLIKANVKCVDHIAILLT